MRKKKARKESGETILLDIKREMAKPREAKSAREGKIDMATVRVLRRNREKNKL
jgi:hypothetical protein